MGKLSDILKGNGDYFNNWDAVKPAGDFGLLPRGVYVCHWTKGELENSRSKGTPGYKLEFTVIEGEHKGRKLWHDLWLTEAAKPQTRRDLDRLAITDPKNQLDKPIPKWIRCNVTVVVRLGDDNVERNKVQTFDVVGLDKPVADAFAPKPPGDAVDPDGAAGTSFDPSKL